ncbi:hypothetical protein DWB58_12790, partial [candidate division KSB1 bacterium]|nr:hypothetical protein [candidate division KSB1 bacterium]
MPESLCDVPGIRVGHAHDEAARTGCTVILPPPPAIAGVDVRGSAPGSREIEALKQVQVQQKQTLTQLEQEKTAQTKQRDEAEKLATERLKQIN